MFEFFNFTVLINENNEAIQSAFDYKQGRRYYFTVSYSVQGAIIFEQSLWHPAPVLNPQKCGSTRVLYTLCIPTIVIIMLYSKVSLSSIEILYVQEGLAFQMEMRLD